MPDEVMGDSVRLTQIMVNLLGNAVKFTESGEVVLSVDRKDIPSDLPGDEHHDAGVNGHQGAIQLHFSVRDTGIGIPPDRISSLFKPFEQLDSSTTRRFGGTGLGLAISSRLAQLMGGTMWAESQDGAGSTFHFTMLTSEVPPDLRMRRLNNSRTDLRGKRMLVVDDNPTNRTILSHQGSSWGMLVRATGSQQEALDWIRAGDPFDIGILDMQMPDMDGITLSQKIREHRGRQELPLFLLTSIGRPDAPKEMLEEFAAHHTKPIKAAQLYKDLCREILGHLPSAESETSDTQRETGPQKELRILLAEDNEMNRQVARRLLEKIGYSADIVEDGQAAVDALHENHYDVILMDVQMPRMDGLEASRRIHRTWPADRRPRIIALTANAMPEDRERCVAAGMDDYLSKPLHSDELAAALARSSPLGQPDEDLPAKEAADSPEEESHDEDLPAVDTGTFTRLVASFDKAFVTQLLETFREDSPPLVATLRTGLADQDAPEVRRAAHTLKSHGQTFGFQRLAPLCQRAETLAEQGDLQGAEPVVTQIEREYETVSRSLDQLQRELEQ